MHSRLFKLVKLENYLRAQISFKMEICYLVTNYSMTLSFSKSSRVQKVSIIYATIFNQHLNFIFRGEKSTQKNFKENHPQAQSPLHSPRTERTPAKRSRARRPVSGRHPWRTGDVRKQRKERPGRRAFVEGAVGDLRLDGLGGSEGKCPSSKKRGRKSKVMLCLHRFELCPLPKVKSKS